MEFRKREERVLKITLGNQTSVKMTLYSDVNIPSDLGFGPRFLTGAAVPFFLGFSILGAGGGGGAGLPIIAVAVDRPGASWSDGAAEGAFLARPSLLIFSEIDMEAILSVVGVPSRELVEGSFLMEVVDEVFFMLGFGVEVLEVEAAEPENIRISSQDQK
jgi:hypothetical protein